ncbi:IS4 family transposase [Paenibacillus sabuli]|uniref:IS4 family transposase n=1 Tax=Paenibacillus sabuli TaxID=2772509 RepID=UPI00295AA425|nr:IS4 family transposase [Paenibacillus sabuli]
MLGVMDPTAQDVVSDRYGKKLFLGKTAILFLEAILAKRKNVAEIAEHLRSNSWLQRWIELESIDQSSLNRRLNRLPTETLRDAYENLVEQLAKDFRFPDAVRSLGRVIAVDSTSITIGRSRGAWAYQQTNKNAVKMHTCLRLGENKSDLPTATVLSTATVPDLDQEVLEHLVGEKGTTHLLDRGYIRYEQFLTWNQQGIFFVARLKAGNQLKVLQQHPVAAGHGIERDEEVEVKHPKTGETERFRLVTYTFKDEKGKSHRVRALTNRWDLAASEVAQAYRYRWRIEVFFKQMKQRLHLDHIYSAKPRAVWNQIYLNLIAYVLCEYARKHTAPHQSFGRMMATFNLYRMKPWDDFVQALHPEGLRTSKGRRKKGGRPRIHPKRHPKRRLLFY